MKILKIILAVLKGLILRVFPSMGPRSVIDTQITVYRRLKNKFTTASENDILNSLIMSRINAPMSPSTTSEESIHYEPLLQNPNKTLEDVIWAIVEYEYILSRGEQLHQELAGIGAQPSAIAEELQEWRNYIKESIKENVSCSNIEFKKLRRDYKFFLWFSPAVIFGIILGISESFSIPKVSDSILIIFGLLFSLGWYLYTVKVVIDTFKVFKIIKPSSLQIGISIFLFWFFFLSPLVMGLYVIKLINKFNIESKNI